MDRILVDKAGSIERYVGRIKDDYNKVEGDLAKDITVKDAIILNLQRACQSAINGANHLIKTKKWGISKSSSDAFKILHQKNIR